MEDETVCCFYKIVETMELAEEDTRGEANE